MYVTQEFVLENLTSEATSQAREITDVIITSTETDEGLMTPFGVVIISGILRYQQDATV